MKLLDGETVIAARLGGDEFALVTRPMVDPARLDGFCRTLHDLLMQPVVYEGHEIPVSASVGAALYPNDGHDSDSVLLAADLALYRAKRDGRGCFRVYDPEADGVPGKRSPRRHPAARRMPGQPPDRDHAVGVSAFSAASASSVSLARMNAGRSETREK